MALKRTIEATASLVDIIEIYTWRGYWLIICILQLLFTHGPQVAPSFYSAKKGGKRGSNRSTIAGHRIL
jgi:hypothetical protein